MSCATDIKVFPHPTARGCWYAWGETRFNPEGHVLCEGTPEKVKCILQSVYGTLRHVDFTEVGGINGRQDV